MPQRSGALAYRPQLITYPDSLTSNLGVLAELLEGPLAGLFHGVHILPPFPSSGDRGFAPLTYREIDPRFGTWEDIARIAEHHDVLLDLMINHLSRQSREFRDFERTGRRSPYADLFITLDKVWPTGEPRSAVFFHSFGIARLPDLVAQHDAESPPQLDTEKTHASVSRTLCNRSRKCWRAR